MRSPIKDVYIVSCKGSTNIGEDHCRCQEKKAITKNDE